MNRVLVFAGTTEGRELTEALCRENQGARRIFACVATEYGRHLLPRENEFLTVYSHPMERLEMAELMEKEEISVVVDATHPYAALASANIKEAAGRASVPYIRLLREASRVGEEAVLVPDTKAAVSWLAKAEGKALLTIGSKELALFTEVKDFQNRFYPRILPTPEMVAKAFELGFDAGHIIAMQGPFSHDTNLAMLRQTGAKYLVTKDSGKAGGFSAKLTAAEEAGVTVVLIGRPPQDEGLSLAEVLERFGIRQSKESPEPQNARGPREPAEEPARAGWFPQFVDVRGKQILIAGAGIIASRRISTLAGFDVQIKVVAPKVSETVRGLAESGRVSLEERPFEEGDLPGADLVLAATDDREVNRRIGLLCREKGIAVNVADRKEECDFYFPAVIRKGDLIVGLTAGGKNHSLAAKGKRIISRALEREHITGE